MANEKLRTLLHTRELHRQILQAYDGLYGECVKAEKHEEADKWLRKGMDEQTIIEQLDEQIRQIWIEERLI